MQENRQNNTKHVIFRAMAVTITLCYILGPAHIQLKNILHTISHNLSAPSYVLQHDADQNSMYVNLLNSGVQTSSDKTAHYHEFLEVLETIFDADSNGDKKDESTLVDFKINKHNVLDKYSFKACNINIIDKPLFGFENAFFKKEYFDQFYRPPKV